MSERQRLGERSDPGVRGATAGPSRLAGTRPFGAARGRLELAGRRIETLIAACTRVCDARLATLDRLPACATVDPFGAVPPDASHTDVTKPVRRARAEVRGARTALAAAGATGRRTAAQLARAARPAPGMVPADTVTAVAADGAAVAGRAAERGGSDALAGALTGMSRLAALLVGDLLERFPGPMPVAPLGRTAGKVTVPAPLPFSPPAAPRPEPLSHRHSRQRAAPALERAQQGRDPGRGGAFLFDAPPGQAAASRLAPASNSLVVQASWTPAAATAGIALAGRLLAELGPRRAAAGRQPAPRLADPAPRAPSRLLDGATTPPLSGDAAGGEGRAPQSPVSDAVESTDAAEDFARQINRLLLDQAWLRGVDLG